MAQYLVTARPKSDRLDELRGRLEAGEIAKMRPFGEALDRSLRGAKTSREGYALWEEEDYCSPPLAMERVAVLDHYFDDLMVERVDQGQGWARVRDRLSLWVQAFGLPLRDGSRPVTTSINPHRQLTQNAPLRMYKQLAERVFALPDVEERPSLVSVPGARALWLTNEPASVEPLAFMAEREFAHLHPPDDGSLHLTLPSRWRGEAVTKGWAEPHPAGMVAVMPSSDVMVYGPRDERELDVVYNLVLLSYQFAKGEST